MRLFKPLSGYLEPEDLPILLTDFTGTAAFCTNGTTLDSTLSFACGPRSKKCQLASSENLNTLLSRVGKLKLPIIDEFSIVGADLLFQIHRRLQDVADMSDPDSHFGGISIWQKVTYINFNQLASIMILAFHLVSMLVCMDLSRKKMSRYLNLLIIEHAAETRPPVCTTSNESQDGRLHRKLS